MAKELPYFKFEPSEWDSGNIQMCSRESKGLFIDLCALYWNRLGELPYALALQKLCNSNRDALQELINNDIITLLDGYIIVEFLDEQLSEFENVSEKRRNAANKRWSDANALQVQSKSNAIREDKSKVDNKKEKPNGITLFDFFGVGLDIDHRHPESMKEASRYYWKHGDKKYSDEQWKKFHEYWGTKTKRGKLKWQTEDTFNIPLRIARFGEPLQDPEKPKPFKVLYL